MARTEARILTSITFGRYKSRPAQERWDMRFRQLEHQQGLCALCDAPVKPSDSLADHCHRTGRLRGVLCGGCNRGMAAIDRGDEWIARAVAYRDAGVWVEGR